MKSQKIIFHPARARGARVKKSKRKIVVVAALKPSTSSCRRFIESKQRFFQVFSSSLLCRVRRRKAIWTENLLSQADSPRIQVGELSHKKNLISKIFFSFLDFLKKKRTRSSYNEWMEFLPVLKFPATEFNVQVLLPSGVFFFSSFNVCLLDVKIVKAERYP